MRRNALMYLRGVLACLLFFQLAVAQSNEDPLVTFTRREIATTKSYKPAAGYVPDSRSAVAIAVAILTPVYGEAEINAAKPWHTGLKDGVWTVVGTFHGEGDGGSPVIQIEQSTGSIRFLGHTQ
jgi:NTF2 fold immunity protein